MKSNVKLKLIGNLSQVIHLATQAELSVREVQHIRGIGGINWNQVTLKIRFVLWISLVLKLCSFYSNSFKHQLQLLCSLAEQGRVPEIIGREFIKNHEEIYKVTSLECIFLSLTNRSPSMICWC
jgi:hypothetical protein